MSDWRKNPFAKKAPPGYGVEYFQTIDAKDRRRNVAGFSVDQCHAALEVDGLQKTVRKAVYRRLKNLGAA